jgi:hypothetical protein
VELGDLLLPVGGWYSVTFKFIYHHQPCSTSKFKYHHHNQDGLKLNGTDQLLVYADDVNILGGSAHTVKENTDALVRRLD